MHNAFRIILTLLVATMMVACQAPIERLDKSFTECASCPESLASAICWTIDGKAYIAGGRDVRGEQRCDMWEYDPALDRWTHQGEMPIGKRVKGSACVVGDEVYIGLGFAGRVERDSSYLRDWWRYTPATGDWTRLADYPAANTDGAVCFTDGSNIYVCYGNTRYFERTVFVYSIADNRWTQMADNTRSKAYPKRALGCVGARCQGRFFLGTGFNQNSLNQWVELTPSDDGDIWQKRQPLPGKGRNSATAIATDDYIYVAGGRYYGGTVTDGMVHDDVLRYSPERDEWVYYGTLPCGQTENMISFTLGGKIYIGLGNDRSNQPINKLYCVEE